MELVLGLMFGKKAHSHNAVFGTPVVHVTTRTYPCHPEDHDPAHQNQDWIVVNNTIRSKLSGLCLSVSNQNNYTGAGQNVWLSNCTGESFTLWEINNLTFTIQSSGLCLDAGTQHSLYIAVLSLLSFSFAPRPSLLVCEAVLLRCFPNSTLARNTIFSLLQE